MIRVLSLIDSLGVSGGGERIAIELTKQLDPARFERTLCVSRWDESVASSEAGRAALRGLSDAGVELLPLRRRSRADLRPWPQLRRYLRERPIDVLHAHKFGSNVWGVLLGRAGGVPVTVAHEHSWAYEGRLARRVLDRRLIARLADALIAVSKEDLRRMVAVEHVPEEKIRLIPNGMPPVPRLGAPADLRAELGIAAGPVIGTVSSLRAEKRIDLLLDAAAALRPRFPDLQVLIAGDGDPAPLEEQSARLGLDGSVRLLGFRSDVAAVIDALDVAVNCSDREGTPLSVLEYMEGGLPVVATRVGGTPDLVEDGVTGLLVTPGDAEVLAGALAELLDDPARGAEMGRLGRERRRAQFGLETMARRVEALYEELLSAKSGRAATFGSARGSP